MNVHVVTSCSAKGWAQYGEKFVETYKQFWPASIPLHVVSEDVLPASNSGVDYRALTESKSWLTFREKNQDRPWVHGDGASPRPEKIGLRWKANSGYSFRHDAWKFSKKVFAIELIAESVKTGRLCWLDADVVTFAPVPADLPGRLLPETKAISCLSRVGYHSECGFVGYNLDHAAAHHFISMFVALYTSGAVFELAEWHDSWVFDWLRNKLLTDTYAIPHRSKGHPFINSELGLYMDHLKGKRKDRGHSDSMEQIANAKVPYWQGGYKRI